jgi:uncharacterized hydrophobic protein (TIGR00271 family)
MTENRPKITNDADGSASKNRHLKKALRLYLRHLFGLHEDTDHQGTTEEVMRSIEFRGANLWTLVFAIFIASIGLNMNSTAVIIGAMLISPLMGPIVGIGFGLGTNDFPLFRRALRHISVAVFIAILTSFLYFLFSPFKEAQSEILARTNPTAFDVLIAIFGGLTGIVATSRKQERGNAISGVAIATALMPPLCTVGFGLASGQYKMALGAFYLFFINSLFIAVSTMAVVRYLNFPRQTYVDKNKARRAHLFITLLMIGAIIPSVFTVINILHEGLFYRKVNAFLESEFTFPETAILTKRTKADGDSNRLEITLYGRYLPQDSIKRLERALKNYDLANTSLYILQQGDDPENIAKTAAQLRTEMEQINTNLRVGILEDLYRKNDELIQNKDARIQLLEKELVEIRRQMQSDSLPLDVVMNEIAPLFPKLKAFGVDRDPVVVNGDSGVYIDSLPRLVLYWKKNRWPQKKEKVRLVEFLEKRLQLDSMKIQEIR